MGIAISRLDSKLQRVPFFYGWVIVAVIFLDGVAVGSHHNTFGVLIEPMTGDLKWSKSQLLFALTIGAFASGFAGPLIGPIIDKYGPRLPLVISTLLGGFILLGVAWTHSLWQFYLLYGILFGVLRPAISELIGTTTIPQWFIKKRTVAFAAVSMSNPFGAAVMVPVAQFIVLQFGWRAVWVFFALLIWVLVSIPGALFMRRRPEDVGLVPDGISAKESNDNGKDTPYTILEEPVWTIGEAIRTRAYWLIILATTVGGSMAGGTLILYLFVFLMSKGMSSAAAAGALSVFAGGLVCGRFIWGFLLTHVELRRSFIAYGIICALTVVVLMAVPAEAIIILPLMGVMGAIIGGGAIIYSVVWPDYFGRNNLGAIRGITLPVSALLRGIGPLLVAVLFDATGSYDAGFRLFVLWYLIVALSMLFAKKPSPSQPRKAALQSNA